MITVYEIKTGKLLSVALANIRTEIYEMHI